jgi:hypothetical protein
VRGVTCITCHTTDNSQYTRVNSNFISDFAFGGDGKGRDYFFGKSAPSIYLDNPYGLRYPDNNPANPNEFSGLSLASSESFITLNQAVPSAVTAVENVDTLSNYIKKWLPTTNVSIAKSIYIGAPNANRLKEVFGWTAASGNLMFKKSGSLDFSGISLSSNGQYYKNTAEVFCEGDLLVVGVLYLENLKLRTITGCRIHATETIFVSGPITYDHTTQEDKYNLQLVSSRAIVMGLGRLKISNKWCPDTDYFKQASATTGTNSFYYRFITLQTLPSTFTRDEADPVVGARKIYDDAFVKMSDQVLYDATCQSTGRGVAFDRLLLNAPQVHSRYTGNLKGTVIAEFALLSLGRTTFEYDPVFSDPYVHVLPMLKETDYLDVGF